MDGRSDALRAEVDPQPLAVHRPESRRPSEPRTRAILRPVTPALIDITPSPTALQLGPLAIGWYGLGYVVAVSVLVLVTQREAPRRGFDPRHVTGVLIPAAVLALIGARLYHVIDQWHVYQHDLPAIVLPPYSGLGLYGGIAGAALAIWLYVRRNGLRFSRALDAVIPGTLFAQGIARWGNFFNQELYGPPTDLPWGIAIDCAHRVVLYPCATFPEATTGFHPLFFYESALTILGGFVALWLAHRQAARLRDGDLASYWAIWYGSVRTILETFREGYNWTIAGIPAAMLVGLALVAFGVVTIVWRHRRPRPTDGDAASDEDRAPVSTDGGGEQAAAGAS
jgi:phosphatidylglycerol:prolipoprotein diacylglycerol transferase